MSNDGGPHSTPLLEPSAYSVSIEREGLPRIVRENVVPKSFEKARLDVQSHCAAQLETRVAFGDQASSRSSQQVSSREGDRYETLEAQRAEASALGVRA